MMDALESFSFLAENVPTWITRLDDLSRQVSERYIEFTKLSRSSIGSISRKRTGSTESLRPDDAREETPTSPESPSVPPVRVEINPGSKHIFREIREDKFRRKRKSGSIVSGTSGPPRFRSRMSVIIYYDSAIQDDFQWLVRNISAARNNLRKGKTVASFKARMASMGMDESPFGGEGEISLRNPNIPRLPKTSNSPFDTDPSPLEAFELADKDLEAAQTLCEVGAHQFLRDGSCNEELGGTKERFESCLRLATEQIALIRSKEADDEEANRIMSSSEAPDLKSDPFNVEVAAVQPMEVAPTSVFETGAIEVDQDDDSNSIHIDLSAFRSTRRMNNR